MRFRIIGTVSLDVLGPVLRGTDFPSHVRDLVDQGKQLRNIMAIRPGQDRCQRNAMAIGQEMVLAARFAPIRGIWAGFLASARSTHGRAIHQSAIPVDLVGGLKFREQRFKKALPNPLFVPSPQMAPAGLA